MRSTACSGSALFAENKFYEFRAQTTFFFVFIASPPGVVYMVRIGAFLPVQEPSPISRNFTLVTKFYWRKFLIV